MTAYYDDKLDSLADIFGASSAIVSDHSLIIGEHRYPIVDDVIIALDSARHPAPAS